MQTVVQEMSEIASAATASASAVEELGRRSDEISSIVEVIKEVADQTNLLALNGRARGGVGERALCEVADGVRAAARAPRTAEAILPRQPANAC